MEVLDSRECPWPTRTVAEEDVQPLGNIDENFMPLARGDDEHMGAVEQNVLDENVPEGAVEPNVPIGEGAVIDENHVPIGEGAVEPNVPIGEGAVEPNVPIGEGAVEPNHIENYVPIGGGAVEPKIDENEGGAVEPNDENNVPNEGGAVVPGDALEPKEHGETRIDEKKRRKTGKGPLADGFVRPLPTGQHGISKAMKECTCSWLEKLNT